MENGKPLTLTNMRWLICMSVGEIPSPLLLLEKYHLDIKTLYRLCLLNGLRNLEAKAGCFGVLGRLWVEEAALQLT